MNRQRLLVQHEPEIAVQAACLFSGSELVVENIPHAIPFRLYVEGEETRFAALDPALIKSLNEHIDSVAYFEYVSRKSSELFSSLRFDFDEYYNAHTYRRQLNASSFPANRYYAWASKRGRKDVVSKEYMERKFQEFHDDVLSKLPNESFLLGTDSPTLADVALVSHAVRLRCEPFCEVPGRLRAYLDFCDSRFPGFLARLDEFNRGNAFYESVDDRRKPPSNANNESYLLKPSFFKIASRIINPLEAEDVVPLDVTSVALLTLTCITMVGYLIRQTVHNTQQ